MDIDQEAREQTEVVGDCIFAAEPFRMAAVDRAVPGFTVPYEILPSPDFETPARFVGKCRPGKWREDGGTRHVEKSIDQMRERKPGGASVKRGGRRDGRQLF